MSGKLIVLEGLDGSGKATQASLLADALQAKGLPARRFSFPNYESEASAPVRMYLSGAFGSDPGDVNAYAASTFFAVDRYAAFRTDLGEFYRDGGVVVADRYTTSNAIHQCSKLPREQWEGFLHWLFSFEYDLMGIPRPDRVIYLQVDPAVSQKLLLKRYHGDGDKRDIHEKNADYLERSRMAADYCADHLGWDVLRCCRGEAMRAAEEIHKDIIEIVREFLDGGECF